MAIKPLSKQLLLAVTVVVTLLASVQPAFAVSDDVIQSVDQDTVWYDPTGGVCSTDTGSSTDTNVALPAGTQAVVYGSASKTASLAKSIAQITQTASTDTNATSVNAKIFYQYFVGLGLTPTQAAGLMGNIAWESHFRADNASELNWPSGGYGLAQWTNGRRDNIVKAMNAAGIGSLYNEAWDAGKVGHTPPDAPGKPGAGTLLGFELDYLWYELNHGYLDSVLTPLKKTTTAADAATVVYDYYEGLAHSSDTTLPKRINLANHWYGLMQGVPGATDGGTIGTGCAGSDQTATAGQFFYYNQNDPKWASVAFNGSTIKVSGCGATSYAMAVASLNNDSSVTPATIANWSQSFQSEFNTGYVGEVLAEHGQAKYGINYTLLGNSMSKVVAALKAGDYVILGGNGPAPYYTGAGHIVLAHGITGDGKLIIADPERGANDQYDPAKIAPYTNYAVELSK